MFRSLVIQRVLTVYWVDCLFLLYYRGLVEATSFRRAALGDNPTQEQIDAVIGYEFQQHRLYLACLW